MSLKDVLAVLLVEENCFLAIAVLVFIWLGHRYSGTIGADVIGVGDEVILVNRHFSLHF